MSAKEELVNTLKEYGLEIYESPIYEDLAARILVMHAHELAEKIRERADERDRVLGRRLDTSAAERGAADLIDPKGAHE